MSTARSESTDGAVPWYREFWAWFVLTPLIVVVISCSITVSIAVINADDRVVDNYYKEGRMINARLDEDIVAASIDLQANLQFDHELSALVIHLTNNTDAFPNTLVLELSHVSDKTFDHQLVLQHIAKGQYHTELDKHLQYRWYLRLRPSVADLQSASLLAAQSTPPQQWRLRGDINFSLQDSVLLSSNL